MPNRDHSIPSPPQILDPAQACFVFPPDGAAPVLHPAALPAPAQPRPSVRQRQPPRRARISFDAPARLKARLDRLARELDRSKTTLLRDGLSQYLAELAAKGGET